MFRRRFWILILVVLAIAAETRFLGITDRSLWFDEAFSVSVARFDLPHIVQFVQIGDTHPPFYYALLSGWVRLFGTSELGVRSLSALLGVLTVLLLYAFASRLVDREVAVAAAALAASSAFAAHAGQEARMYPLLGFLALASWFAMLMAIEDKKRWGWALYVVSTVLMLYTHYFGFLVLGAQALYLAPRLWGDRRTALAAGLALGCVLVLFIPWVPAFIREAMSGRGWPTFRPPADFRQVLDLLGMFGFGGELLGMGGYFHSGGLPLWEGTLITLPFVALVGAGLCALRGGRAWLLICYWAVPIATAITVSQRFNIFYARYFSFLVPAFALLVAAGVDLVARRVSQPTGGRWLGRSGAMAVLVVLLLGINIPVVSGYTYQGMGDYDWRGAAEVVTAKAQPNDYILFVPGFAEVAFEYYYKGALPRTQLTPLEVYRMVGIRQVSIPRVDKAWGCRLAAGHPHLWIVATFPFPESAYSRLQSLLKDGFEPDRGWDFHSVFLYQLRSRLYHSTAAQR